MTNLIDVVLVSLGSNPGAFVGVVGKSAAKEKTILLSKNPISF